MPVPPYPLAAKVSAEIQEGVGTGNFGRTAIASTLDAAFRDGYLACVAQIAESNEELVEIVAATLSAVGIHNPNPRKPGEEMPQSPWAEQPEGWRRRCKREGRAVLSALAEKLG